MKTKILKAYHTVSRLSDEQLQNVINLKSQAGDAFLRLDSLINSGMVGEASDDVKNHPDYQFAINYYLQALDILPSTDSIRYYDVEFNHYIDIISHLADLYSWAGENALSIYYNQLQLNYPEILLDFAGTQTDANIRFNIGVNLSELAGNTASTIQDNIKADTYVNALEHLGYAIEEYRRLTKHYEGKTTEPSSAQQIYFFHSMKDHYIKEVMTAAVEFDKALMGYAFLCRCNGEHCTPMDQWEDDSHQQEQWLKFLAYQGSSCQLLACYSDRKNLAVGSMEQRMKTLKGAENFQQETQASLKPIKRKASINTGEIKNSYGNLHSKLATVDNSVSAKTPHKKRSKIDASKNKSQHFKVKINLAKFRTNKATTSSSSYDEQDRSEHSFK